MKFEDFVTKSGERGINITGYKPWKQGGKLKGPLSGKGGFCAPLSTVWLRFRHDVAARASALDYLTSADGLEEITHLLASYIRKKNYEALLDHLAAFGYTAAGIKLHITELSDKQGAVPASVGPNLLASIRPPGYYLVGFEGRNGAHQIAVDGSNGTIFDPNYGEFTVTDRNKTATCTVNLIKQMYKDLHDESDFARVLHGVGTRPNAAP